jgi:hypothetical protein
MDAIGTTLMMSKEFLGHTAGELCVVIEVTGRDRFFVV